MKSAGAMFHEGELALQERTGDAATARVVGKLLSPTIPEQARAFVAQQSMVCAAMVDPEGRPWPYLLFGDPGFLSEQDGRWVGLRRSSDDAHPMTQRFWEAAVPGLPLGLLLIDLTTRRRIRINGRIATVDSEGLRLEVQSAYPNCPKYIQRRAHAVSRAPTGSEHLEGTTMGPAQRAIVERADTLFVGSFHASAGVDASHRGGSPGFIRVVDSSTFEVPDYAGNRMYNTLGNFLASGRGGLAIVDPRGARLLCLTGEVLLQFDRPEGPQRPTGGTGRWWRFRITQWRDEPLPERFPAVVVEPSPAFAASSIDLPAQG